MCNVWPLLFILQISVCASLFIKRPCLTATWSKEGKTLIGSVSGNNKNDITRPYGLFMDSNNNLYIADTGNNRVLRVEYDTSNGTIVAGFEPNQLYEPRGITIDKEGNLFVLDGTLSSSGRVTRWQKDVKIGKEIFYGAEHFSGIVLDENEEFFYLSETFNNQIIRYTKDGLHSKVVVRGHGSGSALYQLDRPWHAVIDRNQTLYIADSENNRVLKWVVDAPEGTLVAGGHGYGNETNQFKAPRYLLIDDQMNILYVTDTYNSRIVRVLLNDGSVTIIAGGNGQGNADNQLSHPNGLAFDSDGNLYVSDTENDRIQIFHLEKSSCNNAEIVSFQWMLMFSLILFNILKRINNKE